MTSLQRIVSALAIAAFAFTLCGCNTMKGAGKDMENAGEEVQEAADDAQN